MNEQKAEKSEATNASAIIPTATLPETVRVISAERAEAFLEILVDLEIGKLINEIVKEKQSDSAIMKPVTAKQQLAAGRKSRGQGKTIQERVLEVQLKIDYQQLFKQMVKAKALSRMCAIVMDVPVEEVNVAEATPYIPFFLAHCTSILQGLVNLVVTSV